MFNQGSMVIGVAVDNESAKFLLDNKELDAIFIGKSIFETLRNTGNIAVEENNVAIKEKIGNLNIFIEDLVNSLGITPNLSGYKYIVEAVKFLLENLDKDVAFTKVLYPHIAKKYGSNSSRVERAIRHSVESRWMNIMKCNLSREIFGKDYAFSSSKPNPTNSEFIKYLVNYVKRKLEDE